MSDEQLRLTLKEVGGEPVSPADSGTDRAARRPQRAAAAPALDRPVSRPYFSERRAGARRERKHTQISQRVREEPCPSELQSASSPATRPPRRGAWRFPAWCGTPSTARSCTARRSATSTTRRTNRTHGRHGRDRRVPARSRNQAVGAGARRRAKPGGRPGGDACRGKDVGSRTPVEASSK